MPDKKIIVQEVEKHPDTLFALCRFNVSIEDGEILHSSYKTVVRATEYSYKWYYLKNIQDGSIYIPTKRQEFVVVAG